MTITNVKIRSLFQEERLKAFVSVIFDNEIIIHDIKVIQTPNRLIAAMPSHKDESGTFRDIAHPINNEARKKLEEAVFAAYEEALENSKEPEKG